MNVFFAILTVLTLLLPQETYRRCPPEGTAKRSNAKELNVKKNRYDVPRERDIVEVSLADFRAMAAPPDGRYAEGQAIRTTGYVADVRIGAIETCNCKEKDHWLRDTHIELTDDPMRTNDKTTFVVVEVTPRFRERMKRNGRDWSQRALRDAFLGRWVTVTGWLFWDDMHEDESAGSGNRHVWRGTAWEIHPVTDIVITTRPRDTITSSPTRQCSGLTADGRRCSRNTTARDGRCWQHKR